MNEDNWCTTNPADFDYSFEIKAPLKIPFVTYPPGSFFTKVSTLVVCLLFDAVLTFTRRCMS